jgi:VanZ family protein
LQGTRKPGFRAGYLAPISFAVYALLTAYASLYPLEGWRDHGLAPFDYLFGPPPRHITRFDLVVNVLGYVPFGFLCVAALYPRLRGMAAFAAAVAGGAAGSILLEAAQNYLPSRFATNVDVLANIAGTLVGAAAALRLAPWLMEHGPVRRLRAAVFLPGAGIDFGLVLIGLWLFTQLNPATLLFGAGDLRDLVAATASELRAPQFFVSIEALTAAANLAVIALLLASLTTGRPPVRAMVVALVATALGIKSAAFALTRADAFVWLTPGAQGGLAAGLLVALAAVALPRTARLVLAAVLVMAATVLVNLAPPNPYFAATLRVWQQGHFLNFNGLTRLVSMAWPFFALGYLMFLATPRARKEEDAHR